MYHVRVKEGASRKRKGRESMSEPKSVAKVTLTITDEDGQEKVLEGESIIFFCVKSRKVKEIVPGLQGEVLDTSTGIAGKFSPGAFEQAMREISRCIANSLRKSLNLHKETKPVDISKIADELLKSLKTMGGEIYDDEHVTRPKAKGVH